MKSHRKNLLPIDTIEVPQTASRMRQMSITEAFKKAKPCAFKMKPFQVSNVVYLIDSDSDVELEPEDIESNRIKNVPASSDTDLHSDSPSPPKRIRTEIDVNMPITSTPTATSNVQNWPLPQILEIASLNTATPLVQTPSTTVSPDIGDSNSSNKTISCDYTGQTSDASTVPNSPVNMQKSSNITIHEILVLNDPTLVNDTTQNALDSFPNTTQMQSAQTVRRKLFAIPEASGGNISQTKQPSGHKRKPSDAPVVSDKENSVNTYSQQSSKFFRKLILLDPNLSNVVSASSNTVNATPNKDVEAKQGSIEKGKVSLKRKSNLKKCGNKETTPVVKKRAASKENEQSSCSGDIQTIKKRVSLEAKKTGSKMVSVSTPNKAIEAQQGSSIENGKPITLEQTNTTKSGNKEITPVRNKEAVSQENNPFPQSNKKRVSLKKKEQEVENATKTIDTGGKPDNAKKKDGEVAWSSKLKLDCLNVTSTGNKSIKDVIESPKTGAKVSLAKSIQKIPQPTEPDTVTPQKATTPRKIVDDGQTPCCSKSLEIKTLKAKEGKQLQLRQLKELVNLFKSVLTNRYLRHLLSKGEYNILKKFDAMEDDPRYYVMKLFIWKRTWYNVPKFCQTAKSDMSQGREVIKVFKCLEKEEFVNTDYTHSANVMVDLLNELDMRALKSLMDELRIKPRAKKINETIKNEQNAQHKRRSTNSHTKKELIESIVIATNTQNTLTIKTLRDMVMLEIGKKLGFAIKLKDEVYEALYRAYLLGTFTNHDFEDVQDYFRKIIHLNVTFPSAPIDQCLVFLSREHFLNYAHALKLRKDLEEVCKGRQNKFSGVYAIGKEVYERLLDLQQVDPKDRPDYPDAPHLKRFTAQHIYCGILTTCCENVFSKQNGKPQEVRQWLEFLIDEYPDSRRLGIWYSRLIRLYMTHLEPIDYKMAARTVLVALGTKKHLFSERGLFEVGSLLSKFQSTKRHRIDQIYYDSMAQLTINLIDASGFPNREISSQVLRSDVTGTNRIYVARNNDTVRLSNVEQVALVEYAKIGYPNGEHCEGSLIRALFVLYFWDIIYNPEKTIAGTFLSKLQSAPLDMGTKYFYKNRQSAIDTRLSEIHSQWAEQYLIEFGANNWQNHSHEMTYFGMVMNFIKDAVTVEVLVNVIGRKVLANIFRRLVKDIREFTSGMPDLLVWNAERKIHKFVEVKGENDKLRPNQILWLDYLRRSGASIEVCWVHSIGSKRKKIKKTCVENDGEASAASRDEDGDNEANEDNEVE